MRSIASQSSTCMAGRHVVALRRASNALQPRPLGGRGERPSGVGGAVQPDVLHADLVLVGEEVGHPGRRARRGQHRARRGLALANALSQCSTRIAARSGRATRRRRRRPRRRPRRSCAGPVDEDAVVDSSPAASASAVAGATPTPQDRRPRPAPPASATPSPLDPSTPAPGRAARRRGRGGGRRRTRRAPARARPQRRARLLDQRHLGAAPARGRGDLAADPARADDARRPPPSARP